MLKCAPTFWERLVVMIYDYRVKHNGVWYEPGMDVPTDKPQTVNKPVQSEPKVTQKVETKSVETESVRYSKTEIMRLPKDKLTELCKKNGLRVVNNGTEMKKALIVFYGL